MRALALIVGLVISLSAAADIGSVTELTGAATIKRGRDTITVVKGTPIVTNDRVDTKNGRVKITFKDNTTVNITESSSLIIDDFVYDPKSNSGKLALKAAAGTVRYVSGGIAHNNPNAVKINTPTAAIAVRGTDFVMAVNETGGSMMMLMPACEIEQNINLKGLTCGTGAIDVETPAGIVKMNRPYQATLVETAGQIPTPPVIVNLNGAPINNNLMIAPPQTSDGQNVITAARAAAVKTGDAKRSRDSRDGDAEQQAATTQASQSNSKKRETDDTAIAVKTNKDDKPEPSVVATANPNVLKLYKDKSNTEQIGWIYESLSVNNNNYVNIILPVGTQVQVIVSQDMVTNGYNFSGNRAVGQIAITQNYR